MTDSDRCQIPCGAGSVPRACAPFSPPPPASSVPVVAPPVLVPVAPVMPVMSVSGEVPDRFGNVDIGPYVRSVLDRALLDLDLFAPFLERIVESGTFAPASGIAKAALAATVQASLGKADSAVQPASLFDGGLIKSSLLPSYVDDVLEYSALSGFPGSGETGKIYVARDTNRTYRWSGSRYVEIAASPVTSVNGQTGAVTLAIPAEQVNADWNATEGKARILNKPDTFPPGSHVHRMGDVTGLVVTLGGMANASEVNAALALKADAANLPYALVVPGEWTYSGSGYDPSNTYRMRWDAEQAEWNLEYYTGDVENPWILFGTKQGEQDDLVVDFDNNVNNVITATRASLPGHLADRAVNAVDVSSATTLILPAVNPGHARDLLVRLAISGSTVPTITFAAPTGESITYETDGDEFPAPDEAGTWLYSFTETAAHTFAVSLKKVNTVAQGGS